MIPVASGLTIFDIIFEEWPNSQWVCGYHNQSTKRENNMQIAKIYFIQAGFRAIGAPTVLVGRRRSIAELAYQL